MKFRKHREEIRGILRSRCFTEVFDALIERVLSEFSVLNETIDFILGKLNETFERMCIDVHHRLTNDELFFRVI